ncbi:hypothetical protein LJC17_03375 [Acholeplasma sp. OttesenSCG-928-E16]|nr:hypothetical protein [Acholeplasma sp. OttesenSCG-928-E16]
MNREKEITYKVNPPLPDFDYNGNLKSYGYQNLVATLIDIHLSKTNISLGEALPGNLAWVLVSMHIEVIKPLKLHDSFVAKTWHVQRRGPFFRRDFEFINENGEILFHGTTFSVLLDLTKRAIYLKKELPFELIEGNEEYTIEATPNFNNRLDYEMIEKRVVRNSFIDPVKHMNNGKYGEVAYDALFEEEINNIQKVRRMDLYFHSEMSLHDEFEVQRSKADKILVIQLFNKTKDKKSFTIKFEWE